MAEKFDSKKATSLGRAVQNQSRRVNGQELYFIPTLTLYKEPMRHLRPFHFVLCKDSCRLNDPPDLNELFTIPISE